MATVDFSLEDVRVVVRDEVGVAILASEERLGEFLGTKFGEIEERFEQIDRRFEGVDQRFDRMDLRLTTIEEEVRGTKRTSRKHSADIAELQAIQGI